MSQLLQSGRQERSLTDAESAPLATMSKCVPRMTKSESLEGRDDPQASGSPEGTLSG